VRASTTASADEGGRGSSGGRTRRSETIPGRFESRPPGTTTPDSARWTLALREHVHRDRDHRGDVRDVRGADHAVRGSRQVAEALDPGVGDAETDGVESPRHARRLGDLADALRGGSGDGEDRRRLTLGFVDPLLPARLRLLDDLLLLSLGLVDRRIALPL